MADNNVRLGQRLKQEQKKKAASITVKASELLGCSPEDIETIVENEVESNYALEKGMDEKDTERQPYVQKVTYGVTAKVQEIFEKTTPSSETLIEHMEEQINASNMNERQKVIAQYIVGSLDRNGYLRDDAWTIADDITFKENYSVEEDEVLEVIKEIQKMDPVGIAAHDLKECLLLQLAQRHTPLTPLATRMVDKCFKDFLNNRRDHIARTLGATITEVNEAYEKEIRKLDPKPAGAYDSDGNDNSLHVTPTFIITVEDEQISYEIPNRIPELHVSETFSTAYDELNQRKTLSDGDAQAKEQIGKNVESADIFVSALMMRMETLKQTIEAIIKIQREFFINNGDVEFLKPMKLEDLANITGRNTSVLSRATSSKYMATPWGLMPVRELFSEGCTRTMPDGKEVVISTRVVQNRLRTLIDEENKNKPMSDEALCNVLKQEGYDIQRRTVAKYRDLLGIPVAAQRRKFSD